MNAHLNQQVSACVSMSQLHSYSFLFIKEIIKNIKKDNKESVNCRFSYDDISSKLQKMAVFSSLCDSTNKHRPMKIDLLCAKGEYSNLTLFRYNMRGCKVQKFQMAVQNRNIFAVQSKLSIYRAASLKIFLHILDQTRYVTFQSQWRSVYYNVSHISKSKKYFCNIRYSNLENSRKMDLIIFSYVVKCNTPSESSLILIIPAKLVSPHIAHYY